MGLKACLVALGIGTMPLAAEAAEAKPKIVRMSLEDEIAQICHDYDKEILEEMAFVNKACKNIPGYHAFSETDARFARAVLLKEGRGYAWQYDPGQISNQGDIALSELKKPKDERGGLLGLVDDTYLTGFGGVSHAPRKDKKWDYAGTGINPRLSIRGMWFWLAQNKYDVIRTLKWDVGEKEHEIQEGDCLFDLAKEFGIIIPESLNPMEGVKSRFARWNPSKDMGNLKPGNSIFYRTASPYVFVGQKLRKDMIEGYNGEGYKRKTGKDYFPAVVELFKLTAKQDFER